MKEPLVTALKLNVRGVPPHERLASKIVLGLELSHLKVALGYVGGGSWQAYRGQVRPHWEEVCQAQAGFTEAVERYLRQCAIVVKARLSMAEAAEAREILALMDKRPSELSDDQRTRLVNGIMRHALAEGENQETLRREFRQGGFVDKSSEMTAAFPRESEMHPAGEVGQPPRLSLEQQRLEIKALAMGCGIPEERADQVSKAFFAREYVKMIDGWAKGGDESGKRKRREK